METPSAQHSSKQSHSSKIPTVLQGPASHTQVASGEAIEARLAQKLRSQISPSRIPQASVSQATNIAGSQPLKPAAAKHGQPATDSQAQQCCHGTAQQQQCSLPNVKQYFKPGELSPSWQRNQRPAHKWSPAGDQHQWSPRKQHHKEQRLPTQVYQQHHRHGMQTLHQQEQQHKSWPTGQQRDNSDCNSHQQQHQPQQQRSQRALHRSLHSTAAISGWTASLKLHEFLLHQQQKQEQYWLGKYGKMLGQTASPLLGKPCPNPASMFRHPAVAATYGHGAAAAAVNRSSNSPLKLPQLPATCSQVSIATEPHSTSLGSALERSNARQQSVPSSRQHHDAGVADHSAALEGSSCLGVSQQLPAVAGAAASRGTRVDNSSSSSGGGSGGCLQDKASSLQQQQQDMAADEAFERTKAQITLASVPQLSLATGWGSSSSSKVKLQPVRQLPCRDLESELQVLRAIHGREAAVDKLKACCNMISAAAAGDAGCSSVWLLPSDPMGRLFYRLVSTYRQKTLEVIEAHAAWQRKVSGPPEPYSYKGKPYLLTMGEGLGFLDAAAWLAGRLVHCQAARDVLLVEVTPDGVPLDGVTSFDLRHGPSRLFNPEALRIHMAKKVLAAAGATLPPDTSHSLAAAIQQQQQQLGSSQHPMTHVEDETLADPCAQNRGAAAAADSLPLNCSSSKHEAASAAAAAAALAILSARNSPRDATVGHSATTAEQSAASQGGSTAACDIALQGSKSCDRASAMGIAGDNAAAQMLDSDRLQGLEQQHAQLQQQQLGAYQQQELQQTHAQQVTELPVVLPSELCADAAAATGRHAMLPPYQHQKQQQPRKEHQTDCSAASESAVIDEVLDELVASLEQLTACSIITLDGACSIASSSTASLDNRARLSPVTALAQDTSTLTAICAGDSNVVVNGRVNADVDISQEIEELLSSLVADVEVHQVSA